MKDYIRPIQNFLALATGEPITPSNVKGYFVHEGERYPTDISYQVSFSPESSYIKNPDRLLFRKNDIDFEKAIKNWIQHFADNQTLHNLYFGTRYNEDMFVENNFLSLVIALESYHNDLFPEYRLMKKEEFKELINDIFESIPDGANAKKRIKGLLKSIGNEPSIKDKLKRVFEEYSDSIRSLIENEDQILSNARDLRNDIAHGLSSEHDIDEMLGLAGKLQVVIEIILLKEIGLSFEDITDTMEKNRKFLLND